MEGGGGGRGVKMTLKCFGTNIIAWLYTTKVIFTSVSKTEESFSLVSNTEVSFTSVSKKEVKLTSIV